jgi:lactate dehydrogenase-like 2-hydroxyacid dehydrogenase
MYKKRYSMEIESANPGIKVSNTPGAVVAATADTGIFLLIGALRNFNHGIFELRRGRHLWDFLKTRQLEEESPPWTRS